MQKRFNTLLAPENRGGNLRPVSGASVTVTDPNGALATIYSDNGVKVAANPLTSNATGEYEYYAADGRYTETIVKAGRDTVTISDILLEDPADSPSPTTADIASTADSKGAGLVGFSALAEYAAGTVGKWLQDLATTVGASLIGYTPQGEDGALTTVKGALDRLIKPRVDGAVSRKIVFAGSSTAAGQGATGGNGWAQQVGADLAALGWTVVHESIGGDSTQTLLDRFHDDVIAHSPDVCVIALTIGNEGLAGASTTAERETIYNRFIGNLQKLIWLCKQNRIIPVLGDCTPNDSYDADDYKFLRSAHRWMESQPVANLSWLDAIEDGSGHWRAGFYVDGIHGNSDAHSAIYYSVPTSLFENLLDWNDRPKLPHRRAGWKSTTEGSIPLLATFSKHLRSFTVAFRCTALQANKGAWGMNNSATTHAVRLNTAGGGAIGTFGFHNGTEVLPTGVPILSEHHFAIVYDHWAQTLKLYVDGALVVTATYQQAEAIQWMTFLDRGAGGTALIGTMNDVLVYRTPLPAASVKAIYDGDVPKGSLDLHCPLGDPETAMYSRALNLAPTSSYLAVTMSGVVVDANGASARLQAAKAIRVSASNPALTDVANNEWVICKNTTDSTLKLWVNDNGTMKSVTLS